jgi:hypothetical protein
MNNQPASQNRKGGFAPMKLKAVAFVIICLMLAMLWFSALPVCGSMVWSG